MNTRNSSHIYYPVYLKKKNPENIKHSQALPFKNSSGLQSAPTWNNVILGRIFPYGQKINDARILS